MIAVDSSALLAILLDESDKLRFQQVLAGQARALMSAVNALETAIVARSRSGAPGANHVFRFLIDNRIDIVAFDDVQVSAAAGAFANFGKGIHSRARLNMGDCAAYALAKTRNLPLLFKGNDSTHTDITPAV